MLDSHIFCFFFFFQAEGGIRDGRVTGVQTCALPISGDGTTTATVLAQAIVNEGLRNLAAGANPMQLRQGIEKGVEAVVEYIRNTAKPVEGKKEIAQKIGRASCRERV